MNEFGLLSVLMSGTCRKPAFPYTFLLLLQFKNAPEAREGSYSQNGGYDQIADYQRYCSEYDSSKQEHPPASGSEVIFGLDYNRMKDSDYEKCGQSYNDSGKIHSLNGLISLR